MSRQLEQPHDSNDGEELKDVCIFEMRCPLLKGQINVKGQRGCQVDKIDGPSDKVILSRTGKEASGELDRKPNIADTFNVKEGFMCVGHLFIQDPV